MEKKINASLSASCSDYYESYTYCRAGNQFWRGFLFFLVAVAEVTEPAEVVEATVISTGSMTRKRLYKKQNKLLLTAPKGA